MNAFGRAYKQIMLESKVSENKINLAIDKHKLVVIRYNTHGEWVAIADRLCGVFAYGVTKAGNPCIRVFEYKGDTTTFVPAWKLIRLDRIISWHETKQTFSEIPGNSSIGEFNPNGDDSMSIVYKVAQFDGQPVTVPQSNLPRTSDVLKTGVPTKRQQQKQQSDIKKAQDGLKPYQGQQNEPSNTPKIAQDVKGDTRTGLDGCYSDKPVMKTDTERAMDYLRKQLENPDKIDLSKFGKKNKTINVQSGEEAQIQDKTETPNVVQANPVAQKPIERTGLDSKYSGKPLKKTDTETAMDYLRRQLENPEKIDLDKIPRK